MTQAELALGVGVSVQQIQKYENATNRISASMLYQIATILGVAVGQLFDGLPEGFTANRDASLHQDEHLAFLSSADGKRLNDGLLALSPRLRRHLATLIETVGAELSVAPPVSGEGEG